MRIVASAAILLLAGAASAQSSADRNYNVSGKPALQVEVDDASVVARSCNGCRSVAIHVDYRGGNPNDWVITDMQGGNGIHFALKHRSQARMWGGWHGRSPEVSLSTPAETDLMVRSGDGSLRLAGLRGSIDAHTGDGSIQADDLAGALRLTTGDGSIAVRRAEGQLYATSGDGSMSLEGRLSQFDARSGDGSVQMRLLPGSTLSANSSVSTGDGSVAIALPHDLRADVDASTSSGHIASSLPVVTRTGGSDGDRSHIRGGMNGGGPTLRIHTGDGSIALSGS